jgi:diacylglycerol kinase (ATP)
MRGCVIYNPAAGSAQQMRALRKALAGLTLCETRTPDDARRFAAEALTHGHDVVVAAGGDGTIHQVVNGLMTVERRPILAILPMGTGNDLARTLAMPLNDPDAALKVIHRRKVRPIDVIRVKTGDTIRWCINVSAGGFTGQMNEAMDDKLKKSWGPLAYLRGALRVLPDLKDYNTTIRIGTRPARRIAVMNIIIANGRTAGGGIDVAPLANLEDGLMDVVLVESASKLALAGTAARLLVGNYLNSKLVMHRRARHVVVQSTPGMWFNVDGELIGNEPVSFHLVPHALRVIVGPDYTAAAPAVAENQAT